MPGRILFLHPDLGIGGAERLVVDAALALIDKGHAVSFVTTHHDLSHCFTETKDGTFPVTVVGDWIPRNIFGKFYALCAYIRMIYAALYVVLFYNFNGDVIFCDIVSACIPVFRLLRSHVVFYCHFPDQLLSVPGSKLKNIYRAPLNWIEEKSTGSADVILVNSQFTCEVFKKTFKTINIEPEVLYPSFNTKLFDQNYSTIGTLEKVLNIDICPDSFIFLSINRYERKKNIALAIDCLCMLKNKLSEHEWRGVQLIIAGGFDHRVVENKEYYDELKEKTIQYELEDKVTFLKSPSDIVKLTLLKHCDCLLYTPSNEHFGIVPLEAMYSQKPVIAVNSGGPTETIVNGETGFLCNPSKEDFSSAMVNCINNVDLTRRMGIAGRKRFEDEFSFSAFRDRLHTIIETVMMDTPLQNKYS